MWRFSLICFVGLFAAGAAQAGSWADAMFEELSWNFGSVQRGPAITHNYKLVNKTGNDVHIAGVRVSCGCTSASASKLDLKAGDEAAIVATMDTRRFIGSKAVTIFVTFDQPRYDEVRLVIQADGRDDFSVSPETMAFGHTRKGTSATSAVRISFYGNATQITEASAESNYVQPTFKSEKTATGVTYEVMAKLRDDLPVGRWYTDVWLKTNNPLMPRVRVPLTVEVGSPLTASPESVVINEVKVGAEAEQRVIIRGSTPFKIKSIQGADDHVVVKKDNDEAKALHVLTFKVKADKAGELSRKLKIVTDLKEDGEIEVPAKAQVIP